MDHQIEYSNVKRLTGVEFKDYLNLEAHSHSGLKQIKNGVKQDFFVTDKVRVGKIVDDILTNKGSESYISNPLYSAAKDIASSMRAEIGDKTLSLLTPQVSYLGWMSFEGIGFNIKGRPDEELGKLAVIDFKVNNSCKNREDCVRLIEFMGYDNQLYNYGRLGNKPNHFIFIYSTVVKKTFFLKRLEKQEDVERAENWWINQINEHGYAS